MSCVPSPPSDQPGPQEYLNQLLTLISTLRGGESRYLPLVMAKIRDTLPAITSQLPISLVSKIAAGGLVSGSAFGPLGGINGFSQTGGPMSNSEVVMTGLNAMAAPREGHIKQEPTSGSSGSVSASASETGSPYNTPPFMHYYPLA